MLARVVLYEDQMKIFKLYRKKIINSFHYEIL